MFFTPPRRRGPAQVHVVRRRGAWRLIRRGGGVSTTLPSEYRSQAEAVAIGRLVARADCAEFVVHSRDGRIRYKDSHGGDSPAVPG